MKRFLIPAAVALAFTTTAQAEERAASISETKVSESAEAQNLTTISSLAVSLSMPAVSASSAQASDVCMPATELEASLVDWHNETLASQEGEDTYIWASGVGGSWTMVQYQTEGATETACVVMHGENWTPNISDNVLLANSAADTKSSLF